MELNHQQQYALEQINSGRNFFITGGAGTGKSTLLHALATMPDIAFVAPTASAAMMINGTTIHRLFRLPPLPVLTPENIHPISDPKTIQTIKSIRTLVIDEVSMLRSDVIAAIDYRLRQYPSYNADCLKPFGNRQILLCGDFYQLPPVITNESIGGISIAEYLENTLGGVYAFSTSFWEQSGFQCLVLTESMRQQEKEFSDALNAIRVADPAKLDGALALINSRVTDCIPTDAIRLYPTRRGANSFNQSVYRDLNGEERIFRATITGDFGNEIPVEKELHLKEGERVIITANLSEKVINGTAGVIHSFSDNNVNVLLDDGSQNKTIFPVPLYTWKRYGYKTVFDENQNRDILRAYEAGTFTQYPLIPGYAITIHRSQGLTLSKIAPIISFAFAPGLTYVALSRCRSLNDLYLKRPIMKNTIMVSKEVKSADLLLTYSLERFAVALEEEMKKLNDDQKVMIGFSQEFATSFLRLLDEQYEKIMEDPPEAPTLQQCYYAARLFPQLVRLKRDNRFNVQYVMDLFRKYPKI